MSRHHQQHWSTLIQQGLPLIWSKKQLPAAAVASASTIYVGTWLVGTAGMVLGMIHIGGWTRLTMSGLSMTDWSPMGSLPPLSQREWQVEFARYQQFPEWQQRQSMTLQQFQYIYAWEYGHRMLGRGVGLVFCIPWCYFAIRGQIPAGFAPRLTALASLGATQGLVGWWMVQSGLRDDRRDDKNQIRVQPGRLATHLTMAVITYAGLVWTALDALTGLPHQKVRMRQIQTSLQAELLQPSLSSTAITSTANANATSIIQQDKQAQITSAAWRQLRHLRLGTVAMVALTGTTIVSGALVAGNDAGRAYNTFPTMQGYWIPPAAEMWPLQPWYRNCYETTACVQWNHRFLATLTAMSGLGLVAWHQQQYLFSAKPPSTFYSIHHMRQLMTTPQVRNGMLALGLTVSGQYLLGVTTLLWHVPIGLAAAHQMGSMAVLTSALYVTHALRYVAVTMPSTAPRLAASAAVSRATAAATARAK